MMMQQRCKDIALSVAQAAIAASELIQVTMEGARNCKGTCDATLIGADPDEDADRTKDESSDTAIMACSHSQAFHKST